MKYLECYILEGENPVVENIRCSSCIPSSVGHVKPRMNPRGPPRKAKYSWMTDSVIVPWGKGEKNPGRGVKQNMKP